MKRKTIFWPLTLIATGFVSLLIMTNFIPIYNVWTLAQLLPYLLVVLGIGLVLHARWPLAWTVVSALVVTTATVAVIFTPQLGWAAVPFWGFEPGIAGGGKLDGSGQIASASHTVTGFNRIAINYPAEVQITQGSTESVQLTADDNLLPQLSARVTGETLTIRNDESDWTRRVNPSQIVQITIQVKDLRSVALASSGTITITGIETEYLNIDLNGTGTITASGETDNIQVVINGFGSFYGHDLTSQRASAIINGTGDINLSVQDHLTATINGAGSVGFYGNPTISKKINGLGSIRQLD